MLRRVQSRACSQVGELSEHHAPQMLVETMLKSFVPHHVACLFLAIAGVFGTSQSMAAESSSSFNVWPQDPPTVVPTQGSERVLENRPRPFYQLTDVSTPTVSVFLPEQSKQNGTAVLVLPGGGLQRLAIEHEGLEVAQWLNELGITAFVLKYRVPARAQIGVQDAQRALSIIRSKANQWQVDPDCIGCIGFSAGAEICAYLATQHDDRQYEPIDEVDTASCRPNFAALIYPGGLVGFREAGVKQAITSKLGKTTPPFFIAHAFDDASLNSLEFAVALKKANVPAEIHVYQKGVHGFGARSTGQPLDAWRNAFSVWAESNGWLDAKWARDYEKQLHDSLQNNAPIANIPQEHREGAFQDYFAIQRRLVERKLVTERVAGFKGGAVFKTDQEKLGISHPLIGVMFQSGRLAAGDKKPITIDTDAETILETELGFVIGVDIAYAIPTAEHAKSSVEKIVPVIEMPKRYTPRMSNPPNVAEAISLNIGASRFLVGEAIEPEMFKPDQLSIRVSKDGEEIGAVAAEKIDLDMWQNLQALINQTVERGYTLPAGSIILSGALGKVYVAQPGKYEADYGTVGKLTFEMVAD